MKQRKRTMSTRNLLTTTILTLLHPPSVTATCLPPNIKTIKLASTTSKEIGIFEITTTNLSGVDITSQSTATSSSTRETYKPSLAIDKDDTTYFRSAFGDTEAWFQLQFDEGVDLSRIVIKNRWCGNDSSDEHGCLCNLSEAQLHLIDVNGEEKMMMNLQDMCGKTEFSTDEYHFFCDETETTPHDFGTVYNAINNSTYTAPQATSQNLYPQHASSPISLSKSEALDLISILDAESIPHQCSVAITRDLLPSSNYEKHPVVFCNFNIPIGLYCTAEIQPTTCEEFTTTSKGEVYSHGVASAIYIPNITEDERMMDVYNSSYCARIDVYYGEESIYGKTYPLNVTYRNYEVDGRFGVSAVLSEGEDTSSKFDGGSVGLGVGVGLVVGSLVTLGLMAVFGGKNSDVKESEIEGLTGGSEGKELEAKEGTEIL